MQQGRLYLIALAAMLFAAGFFWWYMGSQSETVPVAGPLAEANNGAMQAAAAVMGPGERQAVKDRHMTPRTYLSPNEYDQGANEDPSLYPDGYKRILSVPFHKGGNILRVYSAVSCSIALSQNADCLGEKAIIVRFDPQKKTSEKIAEVIAFRGPNYGGIFLPLALTSDDKNIVMRAWMGSPGAGGSAVDLGYALIPVSASAAPYPTEKIPRLASALSVFYDSYGKMISLEESAKVFGWSQPGRSPNQGLVIYRDLVSGETRVLADEDDATYEIRSWNEADRTLALQRISYEFGVDCPRAERTLDCAKATAENFSMRAP